jgi:NitT/TauT family transport system permease protein
MMGANREQLIRRVYIPSAMIWVFSSLHLAVGIAFIGSVIGEYLGSAAGVGYLILQAEGAFDADTVVAGVLLLSICALILDGLVGVIEARLLRWRPPRPA